jgi:hypothetical protein
MHRKITDQQACAILKILIEECGHKVFDPRDGEAFVRGITKSDERGMLVCREWRFMGALGFGGKFRNNGNNDNTPYVDCYSEDKTPDRLEMIKRANARLKELFISGQ